MNKLIHLAAAWLLCYGTVTAQCDLDFGSTAATFAFAKVNTTDIVNGSSSGANGTSTQSFDVFDEATGNCAAPGGLDDITFEFALVHTFDQYGMDGIIDAYAGSTHDVTQSTSGLRGSIPLGKSSANETSTGDVRGYRITVTFANHVHVTAQDLLVELNSVNTTGVAHESSAVVFLDETGAPYGTATYDGYYTGSGASMDGSCTAPAKRTASWTVSATGAYTASSTSNTDNTAACNPVGGGNGPGDGTDVDPVAHAGLSAGDRIGGFVFTVYLEDVAASAAPGAETATSTSFTSTLNGVVISSNALLPVDYQSLNARAENGHTYLYWETAAEQHNDRFEVEWSTDGRTFAPLATVAGAGTTTTVQAYAYTHTSPAGGTNYYRLRQVDFDGASALSAVLTTYFELPTDAATLYPTVSAESITVRTPAPQTTLTVLDGLGRPLLQQRIDEPGATEIATAALAAGTYWVRVQTAGGSQTLGFVRP